MHALWMRSFLVIVAVACGAMPVWAAGGPAGRVIPMHHDQLVFPDASSPHRECICSSPSQRNLLDRKRETVYRPGLRADAAAPITLKVLAIRVAFPYEDPDDPLTTGRGAFDLRDTTAYFEENQHNFDSSPHDRRYFETHLRALNLYWNTVSNGELTLDWTVFPYASDSAYQMPQNMSYYGRDRGADSGGVGYGLEQFIVDAATAAAEDPSIVFSDYDAVIFFHPGSDRQSDIAQDTPHDLFTAFVHLGHFVSLSAGVTDLLQEAIIMPETMIQDNRITVMNSVMAHEFGHQLGLVDLYNTRSFLTQIGNFSLMDNNALDVGVDVPVAGRRRIMFGALPVFPDAWSRYYLGFVTAKRVIEESNVYLPTAEELKTVPQTVTPQVVKVPISETEYYLLENRRSDIDGRGDAGLRLDSVTNVVLEPVDTASVTANREYDFLLPGEGMLAWHVDEGVAELDYVTDDDTPNNFLANTLQWDSQRRFLTLIEADGLINFGGYFSAGTGSAADFFYSPHNDSLGPLTNPPTQSNTGGRTGITICNISRLNLSNRQMTFDVAREGLHAGFPVYCGVDSTPAGAPMVTDLTPPTSGARWRFPGDGRPEVFLGYKQYILAFDWMGNPLGTSAVEDTVVLFDTSLVTRTLYPVAQGAPDDGGWASPPMIVNSGVATGVLAAVAKNGKVYAWDMADENGDGMFDTSFVRETSGPVTGPPIIWERGGTTREIFVPVQAGGLSYDVFGVLQGDWTPYNANLPGLIVSAAGTRRESTVAVMRDPGPDPNEWWIGYLDGSYPPRSLGRQTLMGPVLGDVDRDSVMEAVVVSANGRLLMLNEQFDDEDGFPVSLGFTPTAPPVLADVDRDGYLDIIVVGGGVMAACARNGTLLPNFPMVIGPSNAPDTALPSPVAASLGEPDRLTLFASGERPVINSVDGRGDKRADFPRPLGGGANAPLAWALSTVDNEAAIFARANDAYLYAYTTPLASSPSASAVWPMAYRNPSLTGTVPLDDLEPLNVDDKFFVAERAFVYPNPANDQAIVRYWLGDAAAVRIRIFDFAGNLVIEAGGPGNGGAYNEWTWNCNNAASGVYFAHVEVTGLANHQKETVLCKLAVVQ